MKAYTRCHWCGIEYPIRSVSPMCSDCIKLPEEPPAGKRFYVYQISTPEGIPMYIGKGKIEQNFPRIYQHEREARGKNRSGHNSDLTAHIREILAAAQRPKYAILGWYEYELEAFSAEKAFIRNVGRRHLIANKDGNGRNLVLLSPPQPRRPFNTLQKMVRFQLLASLRGKDQKEFAEKCGINVEEFLKFLADDECLFDLPVSWIERIAVAFGQEADGFLLRASGNFWALAPIPSTAFSRH